MCFSCCVLGGIFVRFWRIWASKGSPCWGPFWEFLQILHEKKRAEIEARKLVTFGRLLGGAGGSGEACLSLQILQNGAPFQSRPAPPAGVRRILWATPSAAGPHYFRIADPWHCCKRILASLVRKPVIWHDWLFHFGVLGNPGPILGHWGA